jgi:hypothetical protein
MLFLEIRYVGERKYEQLYNQRVVASAKYGRTSLHPKGPVLHQIVQDDLGIEVAI